MNNESWSQGLESLYLNDGGLTIELKIHHALDETTRSAVFILRTVRQVLLNNDCKFESLSFSSVEGMLLDNGLDVETASHIMQGLAHHFDEFSPVDFEALENFEKQLISLDIYEKCSKKLKEKTQ